MNSSSSADSSDYSSDDGEFIQSRVRALSKYRMYIGFIVISVLLIGAVVTTLIMNSNRSFFETHWYNTSRTPLSLNGSFA